MSSPIKTGLASFGMSSVVFHAPLLDAHQGFKISRILERNKNLSKDKYSGAKILRSYEELINDPDLELIIVNTPDHLHFEQAKMALLAGKNVIVEKPFTKSSSEARELTELAGNKGLMLSVFQNRRWDSDFLTVKSVLNQNLLGKVVHFESRFDRYRNYIQEGTWKEKGGDDGGSVLYNLGSHMIDQIVELFGLPEGVFAKMRINRDSGQVSDSYHLWLVYKDLTVSSSASYLVREAGPRYSIHGTEGSFVKYGMDIQEEVLKKGGIPGIIGWGCEPEENWGLLNSTLGQMHFKGKIESLPGNYMAFYDNIYSVLRERGELIVKPEQADNVIKIIEAAIKSDASGKTEHIV